MKNKILDLSGVAIFYLIIVLTIIIANKRFEKINKIDGVKPSNYVLTK